MVPHCSHLHTHSLSGTYRQHQCGQWIDTTPLSAGWNSHTQHIHTNSARREHTQHLKAVVHAHTYTHIPQARRDAHTATKFTRKLRGRPEKPHSQAAGWARTHRHKLAGPVRRQRSTDVYTLTPGWQTGRCTTHSPPPG